MLQHHKDDLVRQQIAMDIEKALLSLKVTPNKCTIKPYKKVPLKIQFKPVGMIKALDIQVYWFFEIKLLFTSLAVRNSSETGNV